MASDADTIIGLHERHANAWERNRGGELILEKHWMDRFAAQLPAGGSVLDIGCGTGQPIARHLLERGFAVTGIDASPTLIAKCCDRFTDAQWTVADM